MRGNYDSGIIDQYQTSENEKAAAAYHYCP